MPTPVNTDKKSRKFSSVFKKSDDSKEASQDLDYSNDLNEDIEVDDLIDDIEDYLKGSLESQNSQPSFLPPVIKFNKNWTLSVTDLSGQLWCEKQVEYSLLTGRKRVTDEMIEGVKRHEELELEDHELIEVEVETNEDNLGLRLLNSIILLEQLMDVGKCRELWLFDTFGHYTFTGVIDQLTIVKDKYKQKVVKISDTKTRKTRKEPSLPQIHTSSLQVQVYCIMLENTRNGKVDFERLHDSFKCDKNVPFSSPELKKEGCLADLEKKYLKAFKKLPNVSDVMTLEYEYGGEVFTKSEVKLNKENILFTVNYLCSFWDGLREADYVNKREKWKCNMCEFKDECTVTPLLLEKNQQNPDNWQHLLF